MNPRPTLKSQFHATLDMLQQAIERCPEALWLDSSTPNPFWHVAYHALFYVHLYLQPREEDFVPWEHHQPGINSLETAGRPYTREQVLAYLDFCRHQVDKQLDAVDLEAPSGFYWIPFDKLELQIYSIRHVQQHAGELAQRMFERGIDVDWVGMRAGAS